VNGMILLIQAVSGKIVDKEAVFSYLSVHDTFRGAHADIGY